MKTTLKLLACITLLLALNSCFERKTGTGSIVTEVREVSSFTNIEVSNGATVEILKGDSQTVTVSDYQNLVSHLKVETKDSTLYITTKPCHIWLSNSEAKVTITTPDVLSEIKISGSGDVSVDSAFTNIQLVKISGSGSLKGKPAKYTKGLKIKISGSGDIEVSGTTPSLEAKISGSGTINTRHLIADTAICKISGSGDIITHPLKTLEAHISGSGDISYYGTPIVNTHIAGSGDVVKK